MSKSTGNFMTLGQCLIKFGSDATRIALADAGDTLDDANFDEKVANASIMKLFVLEQWIQNNFTKEPLDGATLDTSAYHLWDSLMMNEINSALSSAKQTYSEMKYRNIIVLFNHLLNIKENYLIARSGEKNPFVIARYVEAVLTIMNPIAPHYCQHVWETSVYPVLKQSSNMGREFNEVLMNNGWPQAEPIQPVLSA